ncbi:MAG: FecR domain-containing protein [Nitrosomonadales bacterium]|nr:FecR domain-containing protein [Nitrosomonadales bacterium]
MKKLNLLIATILLMVATAVQAAEVVGKVGYMSGTLVAQRADGTVRVLNRASDVLAGDMLITAKDSYVQVKMNDGAVMTLRPHSNLRIEEFQFRKEEPKKDNAVLRLLKGGFRTVTGLIGKRGNTDAYRVRAAAATIGIRGTDFTSRLCATRDCREEENDESKQTIRAREVQSPVVGRVMLAQGDLSAKDESGKLRRVVLGGPVYEGDVLITGKKAYAVVAFRDESRVSLQEDTVFQVEKFKYQKKDSEENAVLRLFKGGVRVVTGLIGRVKHDNYRFKVSNATIGIRGTGFDAWCHGPCASGGDNPGATQADPLDGAGVYVWSGEVELASPTGSFVVPMQQAAIIARDSGKPVPVSRVPDRVLENPVPRPDSVPVDMDKNFGSEANAGDPGLYVTVHDGHVVIAQDGDKLDLGRGETGFAGERVLSRLPVTPAFMGGETQILDPSGSGIQSQPGGGIPEGGCKI